MATMTYHENRKLFVSLSSSWAVGAFGPDLPGPQRQLSGSSVPMPALPESGRVACWFVYGRCEDEQRSLWVFTCFRPPEGVVGGIAMA